MFLATEYNQYWTYFSPIASQKYRCSFNNIDACQSPSNTNRTFVYIIWGGAGFCSEINQLLLGFAYSVETKRRFLIDGREWNYGNFSDYFNFPSPNYNDLRSNYTFLVEDNRQNDLVDHLKTTRTGVQTQRYWKATRLLQTMPKKRPVAHYFWKSISKETLKFIETCRIRNLTNYIGIHIRKGDKMKETPDVAWKRYIQVSGQIMQTNRTIEQIFVASDDFNGVNELRELKPTWNFFSIHDKNHREVNTTGHFQDKFNRLSREKKLNATRSFMCELQMLVDAQYVICSMSSNVCRLIQILRYQDPSTVSSVDRGWYAL
jgi:hypothetical protein